MLHSTKGAFAECNGHNTRQSDHLRTCFAECHGPGTRQSHHLCQVPKSTALGKGRGFAKCHDPGTRQSRHHCGARRHGDFSLRSARLARGKGFAECPTKNTQQRAFADKFFAVYPLLSVALGKPFAECISGKASDSSSVSRGDV